MQEGKKIGWEGEEKDSDKAKGVKEETKREETQWYFPNLNVSFTGNLDKTQTVIQACGVGPEILSL